MSGRFRQAIQWKWLETHMDKQSTEGLIEEWRKQGFSGQVACRSSIGAADRGAALAIPNLYPE
jgi:hypothetical protein